MNEIFRSLSPGRGFLFRYGRMHYLSGFVFHEDQDIERLEEDGVNGGKITGPDFMSMILQEGSPFLPAGFLPPQDRFRLYDV